VCLTVEVPQNILPSLEQRLYVDKVARIIKGPMTMFFKKTSVVPTAQSAAGRHPRDALMEFHKHSLLYSDSPKIFLNSLSDRCAGRAENEIPSSQLSSRT
jgi:hypothetical protein